MTDMEWAARGTLEAMYREMKKWSFEDINEVFITFMGIYNAKHAPYAKANAKPKKEVLPALPE